jgi:hypothetical protein
MAKIISRPPANNPKPMVRRDNMPHTMGMEIANALHTGAPLSEATLRMAMAWYADLAERLRLSGTAFQSNAVAAVRAHNQCVQRLREGLVQKQARERAAQEAALGLVEIEG